MPNFDDFCPKCANSTTKGMPNNQSLASSNLNQKGQPKDLMVWAFCGAVLLGIKVHRPF